MSSDLYDLERFVTAQEADYSKAISELQEGRKKSHWMWYVFPQFAGLGRSEIARFYAIQSLGEATAYLEHPVLGPRLIECCEALLAGDWQNATEILGSPDDLKLRSSATLFAFISPPDSVFNQIIKKFFVGHPDQKTIELITDHPHSLVRQIVN